MVNQTAERLKGTQRIGRTRTRTGKGEGFSYPAASWPGSGGRTLSSKPECPRFHSVAEGACCTAAGTARVHQTSGVRAGSRRIATMLSVCEYMRTSIYKQDITDKIYAPYLQPALLHDLVHIVGTLLRLLQSVPVLDLQPVGSWLACD